MSFFANGKKMHPFALQRDGLLVGGYGSAARTRCRVPFFVDTVGINLKYHNLRLLSSIARAFLKPSHKPLSVQRDPDTPELAARKNLFCEFKFLTGFPI